jgi:phage terminase small subunit
MVWAVAAWLHARASADLAVESIMELDKSGVPRKSPLFTVLNQQAGIMLKASAEMGFTPAARIRVAAPPQSESSEFDEFS